MLVFDNLKLAFQDSPKVASTTIKSWLYACVYGDLYPPVTGTMPNVHNFFNARNTDQHRIVDISQFRPEAHPGYFVFAVTRDPVRRFISAYSNRVVFHRELGERAKPEFHPSLVGLPATPTINVMIDNLDAYRRLQHSIRLHTQLQVEFLGRNLGIYSRIVDIRDVDSLRQDILGHFARLGLDKAIAAPFPAERLQAGGPKLGLEVLNPYSFERLVDFYREDYDLLPTVNLQATRDAWMKARQDAQASLDARVAKLIADVQAGRRKAGGRSVTKAGGPASA